MLDEDSWTIYELAEQFVLYGLDLEDSQYWLFDIEDGDIFELNETSYFVLSHFDGGTPLKQAYRSLVAEYPDEDEQTLLDDFKELLDRLRTRGVLRMVDKETNAR